MKKKEGVRDSSSSTDIKSSTQSTDSKTIDVKTLRNRSERITVRIEPTLKKAVLGWCRANGLSFCHVVEGLLAGYLYGVKQEINLDVKSPTINLTVVREVKRARRYAVEGELDNDLYCALKDRYFTLDVLPTPFCLNCPNMACRSSVLKIGSVSHG